MSKSDSEPELTRGRMADAHEPPSEPNRDHTGNLNSPSHILIDFADQVMARASTASTIEDDFLELPVNAKEKVLKELVEKIMGNLLEGLPEVEKEEFLDVCFTTLYKKLPWRSQVSVANRVQVLTRPMRPEKPKEPEKKPEKPEEPDKPEKPKEPEEPEKKPEEPEKKPEEPDKPEKPERLAPPGMFFTDIPKTIGSGEGRGGESGATE